MSRILGACHSRARAVENFSYLVGACQGGTHSSGRNAFGNSLIVAPWGNVVAKNNGIDEGVIYADLDLAKLHETRKSIPIHDHQTITFDISNLDKKSGLVLSKN